MLNVTLAQLKSDIAAKMKGTSIREVKDFYGTAAAASNRMNGRIDTEETRRTNTLSMPFYDNLNDYVLVDDYKRMIDIRPQVNLRQNQLGLSNYSQTTARQFSENLDADSFSIRWNSGVRTLRSQRLPAGNVITMDTFDSQTANGAWVASGDASGIYAEPLQYVQGNASMGFNLSGSTGSGVITNATAAITDLSQFNNENASMLYVYIPVGYSSRFTNFNLKRGTDAANYISQTVTAKADGTAFSDGWNLLVFNWVTGTTTGSPTNTLNTYRVFTVAYSVGTAINNFLIDSWTDSFGQLYEIEYYSEYMFRTAAGIWIQTPTLDTDLVNVGTSSYEIIKTEMMVDITQQIRTGSVRASELSEWRYMLDGQPPSRYVKDPQNRGLYANYQNKFPSSAIVTATSTYTFDV